MWCAAMRLRGGWVSAKLTQRIGTGKFLQVAPQRGREAEHGARVILENSTVCHSRRISLLCPVIFWVMVSNMILTIFCRGLFCSGISSSRLVLPLGGVGRVLFFYGEFDPGSGRTLAACLTHASRAERPFGVLERRTGE